MVSFDNEIRDRVAVINKNNRGDKIVIELLYDSEEDKNNNIVKAVDLRQHFTGNEEGIIIPTKKGIRIPSHVYEEVVTSLASLIETVNSRYKDE